MKRYLSILYFMAFLCTTHLAYAIGEVDEVPEPTSLLLLGSGIVGLLVLGLRRKKS
jgi:hypothetical protein